MPIFEYFCDDCSVKTERIKSQPLEQITCPNCGKKANKVVSITAQSKPDSAENCSAPAGSGFG